MKAVTMHSDYPQNFSLPRRCALTAIVVLFLQLICPVFSQAQTQAGRENPERLWSSRVKPLLDKHCLKCHAGVQQAGGLDMRSLDTILRGGERGMAIHPSKPNDSRIVQYVQPNAATHMPPDPKKQLSAPDIAALKTWIAALPAPKSKPPLGKSKDTAWVAAYLAEYRKSIQTHPLPPAKLSASATIDWFLETAWRRDKIVPASLSSDTVFARRVYLDVAGRIPSQKEMRQFVNDTGKDKRERLVAKLLASDDYPRHFRAVFDTVLMGRPNGRNARARAEKGWNRFLEESFRANRPWNEMVREMLTARATEGVDRGAVWFLAERKNSSQAIAEAIAPIAFGVKIECAQCHNHPLAWEIEQRHYWGMVAAFNRSKTVETDAGTGIAESAIGGFINFANLKKESQPAMLAFLNGKTIPERIPAPDEKETDSPELYLVPPAKEGQKAQRPAVPKFSRREAFADAVTRGNPLLARAFVNRMWTALMGRGLSHPADQIDSWHRASHPELLEWLARDFEASGYDVKKLVQTLVLSRAYQLDSKPNGKTPPRPESFARGLEKPLSAEQLLHSLQIATGNKPDEKTAAEWERMFAATFPDVMPETYNPSLQQALFLSNSPILDNLLTPTPGSTVSQLRAINSDLARVKEAFQTVLGRAPDDGELQQCQSLLAAQKGEKGVRNLLWALLTSAEFQVNH
jgi:hypothetical protein